MTVYTRPIRIDDPEASKAGLKAPYRWYQYVYRLARNETYMMTPWAGVHELAFAPVGQPVSKAVARGTFEAKPGEHLIVATAGRVDRGETRVIARNRRSRRLPDAPKGKSLVRVWNLVAGGPPLNIEVAWDPARNSCRAKRRRLGANRDRYPLRGHSCRGTLTRLLPRAHHCSGRAKSGDRTGIPQGAWRVQRACRVVRDRNRWLRRSIASGHLSAQYGPRVGRQSPGLQVTADWSRRIGGRESTATVGLASAICRQRRRDQQPGPGRRLGLRHLEAVRRTL